MYKEFTKEKFIGTARSPGVNSKKHENINILLLVT